jgi:thermostable 8-oxoguanine DNA glycosylase
MITPTNITNYNRTQAELEEFLLFAIIVAGKTAKTQAEKLNQFLKLKSKLGLPSDTTPFQYLQFLCNLQDMKTPMMVCKLGQYNRIEKAFRGIIQFHGRLDTVSVEELESVEGIGPKTARFFLLHSRPNQRIAALDTHILKYMSEKGYNVPKSTPSKKKYRKIELDFLSECDKAGKNVADMDLEIWKSYATRIENLAA